MDFVEVLLKLVAYITPYFLIPVTFKYGLGVFGNLAGMINDRSRGFFDRQRKAREGFRTNARQAAREGRRFAGGNDTNWRGALNRGIGGTMNAPRAIADSGNVLRPWNWGAATTGHMNRGAMAEVERNMKENASYQSWMHDDDLNRAAAESHDEASLRAALRRADQRAVANGGSARFSSPAEMDQAVNRVQTTRRTMSASGFRQMTTRQALAGGTAYDTAGEAWAAVAAAGGNDDAATAALVAAGRGDLMKAGRVDSGAAGFGATLGEVRRMQDELRRTGTISQASIEQATDVINEGAIDGSAAGQAIYGKPSSAKQLAKAHAKRIQKIVSGIQSGATNPLTNQPYSQRDLDQSLASAMGIHDAMGGASPQNARAFADELMTYQVTDPVNGDSISVYDMGNTPGAVRTEAFDQMRRNYQRDYEAQAAQGQAAPGANALPPTPGTPTGQS